MSTVAVAEKPKPKRPDVPVRSGRKTAPIQVEKDLARMAAVVAQFDGITQSELVSPVIRQFLEVEYDRVQKGILKELAQRKQG